MSIYLSISKMCSSLFSRGNQACARISNAKRTTQSRDAALSAITDIDYQSPLCTMCRPTCIRVSFNTGWKRSRKAISFAREIKNHMWEITEKGLAISIRYFLVKMNLKTTIDTCRSQVCFVYVARIEILNISPIAFNYCLIPEIYLPGSAFPTVAIDTSEWVNELPHIFQLIPGIIDPHDIQHKRCHQRYPL